MDNPVVQTDLAELLGEIRQELRTIDNRFDQTKPESTSQVRETLYTTANRQ